MAYKMFAAIYVGSSEISMKIFQVNGRKTFRQCQPDTGAWAGHLSRRKTEPGVDQNDLRRTRRLKT